MPLTTGEISQIATRTADEVMERVSLEREERELRDHIIGGAMGEGAIPLYGRETRKEPCHGCRIDPGKPLEAGNVMATTNNAIGTLAPDEVRNWCSEIIEVADGRCQRARNIKEAARECKEAYPEDTAKFFACYAPAFSKITKESNPGGNPMKKIDTPAVFYHATPAENVHSIMEKGIKGEVYLTRSPKHAESFPCQAARELHKGINEWAVLKLSFDNFPWKLTLDSKWGELGVYKAEDVDIEPKHITLYKRLDLSESYQCFKELYLRHQPNQESKFQKPALGR